MTLEEIRSHAHEGGRFRVEGRGLVAWRYAGQHFDKIYNPEEEDYDEVESDMVNMVMVGDDENHVIDPLDVAAISEEDYCPECGQIGCKAYR